MCANGKFSVSLKEEKYSSRVHARYTYNFVLKCFIKIIYRLFDTVRGIENVSLFMS